MPRWRSPREGFTDPLVICDEEHGRRDDRQREPSLCRPAHWPTATPLPNAAQPTRRGSSTLRQAGSPRDTAASAGPLLSSSRSANQSRTPFALLTMRAPRSVDARPAGIIRANQPGMSAAPPSPSARAAVTHATGREPTASRCTILRRRPDSRSELGALWNRFLLSAARNDRRLPKPGLSRLLDPDRPSRPRAAQEARSIATGNKP